MDYIVYSARIFNREEQFTAIASFMLQMRNNMKFMTDPVPFENIKFEFRINSQMLTGNQVHFEARSNMTVVKLPGLRR